MEPDPRVTLAKMESDGRDVVPFRTGPGEVEPAIFGLVTDGCGSSSLRRSIESWPIIGWFVGMLNALLEQPCRNHDWRYQNGHRQRDRLRADVLLLWDGLVVIAGVMAKPWLLHRVAMLPAFTIGLVVYVAIVLCCGWYTCTLFRMDGQRLAGHPRASAMVYRAMMRREEQNPLASHSERRRASKTQRRDG